MIPHQRNPLNTLIPATFFFGKAIRDLHSYRSLGFRRVIVIRRVWPERDAKRLAQPAKAFQSSALVDHLSRLFVDHSKGDWEKTIGERLNSPAIKDYIEQHKQFLTVGSTDLDYVTVESSNESKSGDTNGTKAVTVLCQLRTSGKALVRQRDLPKCYIPTTAEMGKPKLLSSRRMRTTM